MFCPLTTLQFDNYLGQTYPVEHEIKDTTESDIWTSYLDLLLSIGNAVNLSRSFLTHVTISISIAHSFCS